MSQIRLILLVLCVVVLRAPFALAHDVRGTAIYLDVGESRVNVELQIPMQQLTLALEKPLDTTNAAAFSTEAERYVLQHVRATDRDAKPFTIGVQSSGVQHFEEGDSFVVYAVLHPPQGSPARFVDLHYDAVVDRVVTHNIYVFVRHDIKSAILGEKPEFLGLLHYQSKQLVIDRTTGSFWRGFKAVFQLGVRHIAEGTDHLLFLFMLLLPASLLAVNGRWTSSSRGANSVRQIVRIVTAFTIGHSLTLLLGSVFRIQLSPTYVEVLIAVSILISALHALRPLFAGREAFVAGGFGLVHGLAFASVLAGFGFDRSTLAIGLFGFNLGVEAMQLAIVSVTMPWLMLLGQYALYRFLRASGALFGAIAACGWIGQRAFGWNTPIPPFVEACAAQAPYLLIALASFALAVSGSSIASVVSGLRLNLAPRSPSNGV